MLLFRMITWLIWRHQVVAQWVLGRPTSCFWWKNLTSTSNSTMLPSSSPAAGFFHLHLYYWRLWTVHTLWQVSSFNHRLLRMKFCTLSSSVPQPREEVRWRSSSHSPWIRWLFISWKWKWCGMNHSELASVFLSYWLLTMYAALVAATLCSVCPTCRAGERWHSSLVFRGQDNLNGR
jgi:hypothetical protein